MRLYEQFPLWITNSLSGKKELFQPIDLDRIGMYVCGPTVYSDVHLGNVRTFISFDVIARYLRHLNYKVRYVRNITDVGHLENDEDDGDDKITKKAIREKLIPMEIVQRYTESFHDTMRQFNVLPPDIEPSATGHIIEQIEFIQTLLKAGFAYEVNGSVYFDVLRYNETYQYGILSGRVIEELMESGRTLQNQKEKKNKIDFALWKKASPRHIMRWPSPWSDGFPGWHLECTTMSTKYLGKTFDIHGGGMDLKFPHHECEMAQSRGATGQSCAHYWIHTNMLTMNKQKMSKSLGNSLLPQELLTGSSPLVEQSYGAMTVRFFMLQSHYSSTLDFSNEALAAAKKGYNRLMEAFGVVAGLHHVEGGTINAALQEDILRLVNDVYRAMSDDFNTAKALGVLFEMSARINDFKAGSADINTINREAFDTFKKTYVSLIEDVLGLYDDRDRQKNVLDGAIQVLIALRKKARTDKQFSLSDTIRDDLKKIGIQLKDNKDGTIDYVFE